ncbi:DUF3667 domain-containing protein [Maricaulis sp.]|uniref:DUF3667 domain-containing protein n=1 Tax=Maricaulis sp. TaxID=1486257 RepID=UPI003A95A055
MSGGDNITDAIVAGSAGGELGDAIHASRRKKRQRHSAFEPAYPAGQCSNCGTKLIGPVCHSCGQTAETFHRPIWDLMLDVLDGLFGLEGRLWRTLPPLMFQPGKLTRRYLSGARARYVMPFRLYLTASVLFFLAVFAIDSFQNNPDTPILSADARAAIDAAVGEIPFDEIDQELERQGVSQEQRSAIAEQVARGTEGVAPLADPDETAEERAAREEMGADELKEAIREALLRDRAQQDEAGSGAEGGSASLDSDSVGDAVDQGLADVPIEVRERLADQADRIIDDGGASIAASMQVWAPRLMFGLLPIYALLLAITHFYKRGYFFYDHLVVSLHFHSVLFFGFILVLGLSAIIGSAAAGMAFVVWANYYLYRLHRVVYRHGRFSSLLRTVFLDFLYGIILFVGMIILLLIGILSV